MMSDRGKSHITILAQVVPDIAKKLMRKAGYEQEQFVDLLKTEMAARGYHTAANLEAAWEFTLQHLASSRKALRLQPDDTAQFALDLRVDLDEIEIVRFKRETKHIKLGDFGIEEIDAKTKQIESNELKIKHGRARWEQLVIRLIRPLLVANRGWVYRDAIEHLKNSGGLPQFEDDE